MIIPTPWLVTAALVFSALGALSALFRRQRRDALACASVACGSAALVSPPSAAVGLFVVGAALALAASLGNGKQDSATELGRLPQRYLPIVAIAAVLLVLYRLGADSGPVFLWEHENIHGLSLQSISEEPLSRRVLEHLRWSDAPLAGGHLSAIFGLPSLAICTELFASLWSIRIISALAFLGSTALLFLFVRRSYGMSCAVVAASLLVFNEVAISYGRYAGASAASLCALLAALLLCARLVRRGGALCAVFCALTLYAATLGYAAARVAVVAIAVTTLLGVFFNRKQKASQRAIAAGTFTAVLAGIVAWQASMDSLSALFQARSEQFFYMVTQGGFPLELEQTEVAPLLSNRNPSSEERLQLAWALIREVTGKQLADGVSHWSAAADDIPVGGPFVDRPLGMTLLGCLSLPFILLGLFKSLKTRPFWPSFALLGWFGLNTGALLLTNRIDVHRQFFLIVPLIVWTALGVTEWLSAMQRSSKALGIAALLAAALLPCALAPRWLEALQYTTDEEPEVQSIRKLLNDERGTLFVVADLPPGEESRIRIGLMERLRSSGQKGQVGDSGYRNGLADGSFTSTHPPFGNLKSALAAGETIVLIPAERYSHLTSALASEGADLSQPSAGKRAVAVLKKR